MEITVIGAGRWGSFIAWYLDHIGKDVSLYGREDSSNMKRFRETGGNGIIQLEKTTKLIYDLKEIEDSDIIIISIPSQKLRDLMEELREYSLKNKIFILCMKGIEISTRKRLSQVVSEYVDYSNRIAVWIGPGHPQEFYRGVPNCMVIDSLYEDCKYYLVNEFSSELIRFYYGNDLVGNEIGAAAKNVIGIAAGALDGMNLTSLKGALMSRGTREVSRLIEGMGGNPFSAYGLCHLGDYEATVFSKFSQNRKFGECLVTGEDYNKLAEGYYTAKAMVALGEKYHVDLPITQMVYDVCYNERDPKDALAQLFLREVKNEF